MPRADRAAGRCQEGDDGGQEGSQAGHRGEVNREKIFQFTKYH